MEEVAELHRVAEHLVAIEDHLLEQVLDLHLDLAQVQEDQAHLADLLSAGHHLDQAHHLEALLDQALEDVNL